MKPEDKPEAQKVGVYICHCGGNISDHVDVETVRRRLEKLPGVAVARTNMFMCSDPGQEMIMADLKSGAVDRVVVASCAPSLHEATFRSAIARAGANPYIYEHANIREQVSWVHHGDPATDKASRLVAAAAAKAGRLKPLEPIRVPAKRHVTVVGGGIAGLRAAKDAARRGFPVTLIERSPFLGGNLVKLDRLAPTGEKAADLINELGSAVLSDSRITVLTCARIIGYQGYVGNFRLIVQQTPPAAADGMAALTGGGAHRAGCFFPGAGLLARCLPVAAATFTLDTGVVILATGFASYTPRNGEYGFGISDKVITLPALIEKLSTLSPVRAGGMLAIDGRWIRSVALIHCVGSRQIPGIHEENESGRLNEYCSRTCCTATLDAANRIRQQFPGTRVYDLYRDIRTYGPGQEQLYEQAGTNGVVFLRFEEQSAPAVTVTDAADVYPLRITVTDTLTFGEQVEVPADLLVLATGMEPANVSDLVEMMKLPVGADGFLQEVHPKLRPVEVPVSGIFLAGTCQAPFDVGETCNAAGAAAVKACALLARGHVELDPFVAEVDPARCEGTGACVAACLREGALTLVETVVAGQTTRQAQVTPALCLGCGACVAVCPHNAINVNGMTLAQYAAMVDRIVDDEEYLRLEAEG